MISRHVALDYGQVCTVKQGTWIFEPMFSVECSNIEPEPYHADTPLQAALCGRLDDKEVDVATLSLDGGEPVSLLDGRFGVFMLPGRVVVPENGCSAARRVRSCATAVTGMSRGSVRSRSASTRSTPA